MIPLKSANFDRRLRLSSEHSLLLDVRVYNCEVDLLSEMTLFVWLDPKRSEELPRELPPLQTRA